MNSQRLCVLVVEISTTLLCCTLTRGLRLVRPLNSSPSLTSPEKIPMGRYPTGQIKFHSPQIVELLCLMCIKADFWNKRSAKIAIIRSLADLCILPGSRKRLDPESCDILSLINGGRINVLEWRFCHEFLIKALGINSTQGEERLRSILVLPVISCKYGGRSQRLDHDDPGSFRGYSCKFQTHFTLSGTPTEPSPELCHARIRLFHDEWADDTPSLL